MATDSPQGVHKCSAGLFSQSDIGIALPVKQRELQPRGPVAQVHLLVAIEVVSRSIQLNQHVPAGCADSAGSS